MIAKIFSLFSTTQYETILKNLVVVSPEPLLFSFSKNSISIWRAWNSYNAEEFIGIVKYRDLLVEDCQLYLSRYINGASMLSIVDMHLIDNESIQNDHGSFYSRYYHVAMLILIPIADQNISWMVVYQLSICVSKEKPTIKISSRTIVGKTGCISSNSPCLFVSGSNSSVWVVYPSPAQDSVEKIGVANIPLLEVMECMSSHSNSSYLSRSLSFLVMNTSVINISWSDVLSLSLAPGFRGISALLRSMSFC